MKLEIFEINQIVIFQANRQIVQDLLVLDYEKDHHIISINLSYY